MQTACFVSSQKSKPPRACCSAYWEQHGWLLRCARGPDASWDSGSHWLRLKPNSVSPSSLGSLWDACVRARLRFSRDFVSVFRVRDGLVYRAFGGIGHATNGPHKDHDWRPSIFVGLFRYGGPPWCHNLMPNNQDSVKLVVSIARNSDSYAKKTGTEFTGL